MNVKDQSMGRAIITVAVDGMTCEHCARPVRTALTRLTGVQHAEVSVREKRADVRAENTSAQAIVETVNAAGFQASVVAPPVE